MSSKAQVIAIDGPSASGKSTVARKVAAAVGWLYVDSGALYRGITWKVLEEGGDPANPAQVVDCAARLGIEFFVASGAVRFRIAGVEPVAEIRTDRVNERVSEVAAVPEVRAAVTDWLRGMRKFGSLVMEGRDIGTVVFPDADLKYYLDASPEERARRRHAETKAAEADGVGRVLVSLQNRDRKDSARKTAPLRAAPEARVLDTTGLTVDQVVERIAGEIGRQRGIP